MKKIELNQLLEAGVHFGHLTSKRHPNMSPYIFMEKNGMHVIDLNKTKVKFLKPRKKQTEQEGNYHYKKSKVLDCLEHVL